ncbi:hypothetical protein TRIUR3_08927 [Triticum urartu]|uniref:Uncharacterized protein n=1 Tax=Triticum urartu TaxID=4572 RepID=M7YQ95_TRIUA|nr:hypothetical protein TRIUR3_08927 [Triticum urartu]
MAPPPPPNEADLAAPAALRAPADVISRVFSQLDCVDLLSCSLVCRSAPPLPARAVFDRLPAVGSGAAILRSYGKSGGWSTWTPGSCRVSASSPMPDRRAQLAPSEACEPGALDLQPGRALELHQFATSILSVSATSTRPSFIMCAYMLDKLY